MGWSAGDWGELENSASLKDTVWANRDNVINRS